MTLFKSLMRIVAAAGASALVILVPQLIELFRGPAPSDVGPVVWGVVGAVAVFVLNLVLAAIKRQPEP